MNLETARNNWIAFVHDLNDFIEGIPSKLKNFI